MRVCGVGDGRPQRESGAVAVGEWGCGGCEERKHEPVRLCFCFDSAGHCHDHVVGFWIVYGDAEGDDYGGDRHDDRVRDCYGLGDRDGDE